MKALLWCGVVWLALAAPAEASAYSELNAGIASRNRQSWDEAIRHFSLALASPDLLPDFRPVAYFDRGDSYAVKQQYDQAIADYSACLRADPGYLDAYLHRGAAYAELKKYELAAADYGALIAASPYLEIGYLERGALYGRTQNLDAAIADFGSVVRILPQSSDGYLLRGDVYRRKSEYAKALADENKALDIDAKLPEAYFARGQIYQDQSEFRRALDDYDEGLKLEPGDFDARVRVGLLQWEMGRFDDSANTFRDVVKQKPDGAYGVLWLAVAKERVSSDDSEFRAAAAKVDLSKWPGPLLNLYLGKTAPEDALKAAATGDAAIEKGQTCEADFYVGEWQLIQRRADAAKPLLAQAASSCAHEFVELVAANAELGRIR